MERFEAIAAEVADLVLEYGGALSGEHGDGLVRAPFQEKMFGTALYNAFCEVKAAFDPTNMLNPGKIVHAPALTSNLRYEQSEKQTTLSERQPLEAAGEMPSVPTDEGGPEGDGVGSETDSEEPEHATRFDFSDFGGLLQATEQCSGVGACRKTLTGTMCPSYMATRNEIDSTRGRANALRLALSGGLEATGFGDEELLPVLDLCLECKACKRECPTGVDMARLKSEFLHQYHVRHGAPFKDRVLSQADRIAPVGQSSGPALELAGRCRPGSTAEREVVRSGPAPPFGLNSAHDRLPGVGALPGPRATQKRSAWRCSLTRSTTTMNRRNLPTPPLCWNPAAPR